MQRKNTWVKHGDFTTPNSWNAPRYKVSYSNMDKDSKISSIQINGYDDGRRGFMVFANVQKSLNSLFNTEFKLLKCYFYIYKLTYIGIEPVDDIVALSTALEIFDAIAPLGERKNEIASILGVDQRVGELNEAKKIIQSSNLEKFKLDHECIQIKNRLYSNQGFSFEDFTLKLMKPPFFSRTSNDVFTLTQKDGKELSVPMPTKKIAKIIPLLKENNLAALIEKFNNMIGMGSEIARALENHSITIREENNNEKDKFIMYSRRPT